MVNLQNQALGVPDRISQECRILAVDDIPSNLRTLYDLLVRGAYKVSVASSGEEAVHTLNHVLIDIAVLDIEMPGMSGLELFAKILKNPVWKSIPVIFVTTDKDGETIKKALSMNAAGYILKPYDEKLIWKQLLAVRQRTTTDQGVVFLVDKLESLRYMIAQYFRSLDKSHMGNAMKEAELAVKTEGILKDIQPEIFTGDITMLLNRLKPLFYNRDFQGMLNMTGHITDWIRKYHDLADKEAEGLLADGDA
jgi:CheY-like chemotaxis protein